MLRELQHSLPKPKPVRPARGFQGLGGLCRKENSSQSFGGRLLVVSRCHDGYEISETVPRPGLGIRTKFPFGCNELSPKLDSETRLTIEQGFP